MVNEVEYSFLEVSWRVFGTLYNYDYTSDASVRRSVKAYFVSKLLLGPEHVIAWIKHH